MIKISAALAVLALASPAVPSLPGGATGDGGYEFAVIADTSYRPPQEEEFMRLRKEMNEEDLAFTLHLGDVIGRGPCSDERLIAVRDSFDEFEDPLVYTPGDNEWTDCHRTQEDPLERLTALRRIFFADDRSQGERKLTVTRQAGYPENARWALGPVTFATIHVVGSQDGFGRAPDGDGEQQARRQAVVGWMDETVRAAADAGHHGVVLAMQADPGFEFPGSPLRQVYDDLIAAFEQQARAFPGQVVLIHGDTHYFRVDKPFIGPADGAPRLDNFTRVESFGDPDTHWLRIRVEPDRPELFDVRWEIVESNRAR